MRLEIRLHTRWKSEGHDDLTGKNLLCPSPATSPNGALVIAVGEFDGHVSRPAVISLPNHRELRKAKYHRILMEPYPRDSFFSTGILPTQLGMSGETSGTVVFTGFSKHRDQLRLLSGSFGFNSWTASELPSPLWPIEGEAYRAGAMQATDSRYFLASGNSSFSSTRSTHPITCISTAHAGEQAAQLLLPEGNEFALVRPVFFRRQQRSALFFSVRREDLTYGAGAALAVHGGWQRVSLDLRGLEGSVQEPIYFYPFEHAGETWAVYSMDYRGVGGVVLARCEMADG